MLDPFDSSRRKLARAKKHLAELKGQIKAFASPDVYEKFTEPHPNKPEHIVCKIRLRRPFPAEFSEITSDLLTNLRASLDHAVYAVAVASGCAHPKNAFFPFSKDAAHFESNLKGRCKDVPQSIWPYFRSCKPYAGGNDLLWALNVIRGRDEHALLVPALPITGTTGVKISATGKWEMVNRPVWNSAKNEMELFSITPGTKFKVQFGMFLCVVFGDIDGLRGKEAIPLLDLFVTQVETILGGIEAECRRLGILK